jgi:hypothetical protein
MPSSNVLLFIVTKSEAKQISGDQRIVEKNSIFWDTTPFSSLIVNRRFVATCSSQSSVDIQRTTYRDVPEDRNLHNHRCENLKSCEVLLLCIENYISKVCMFLEGLTPYNTIHHTISEACVITQKAALFCSQIISFYGRCFGIADGRKLYIT